MASVTVAKHVVLTGPPGVGKTTLIRKTCENLVKGGVTVQGFYTEELRSAGKRIGFDVVTLNGLRGPLARIKENDSPGMNIGRNNPKVGNYSVQLREFEQVALPTLRPKGLRAVHVIDEVGKMELFSHQFEQDVKRLLDAQGTTVLLTIPVPKHKPLHLVESIRARKDVVIFEISFSNRNSILEEITKAVLTSQSNSSSK